MSKKSAYAKGYRRNSGKKPYLSRTEIVALVCIVAAIALAIVLFNLFYDDGSLEVVDGVAQVEGENSLIVNVGSANSPRYYKLGETGAVDGYALSSAPTGADENVREYLYTPENGAPYEEISVTASVNSADMLALATQAGYASAEDTVCSEVQSLAYDGRDVQYFTYQRQYEEPAEDAESAEAAESAEDAGAAGAAEPAEDAGAEAAADGDAEGAESAEDAEAAEGADATAEAEPAEDAGAAGAVEPAEDAGAAGAVEPAEDAGAEAAADGAESTEAEPVEDAEAVEYMQVLNAYIPVGERSIVVHLHNDTASEAEYLSDADLVATLEQILAAMNFATK